LFNEPVIFLVFRNQLDAVDNGCCSNQGIGYQQPMTQPIRFQQLCCSIRNSIVQTMEIETSFFVNEHLNFFLNPTYAVLAYDDDLTFQGVVRDTKDKQVIDTPEWTLKSGLIYILGDFELIPMVRYMGSRYGDAEHNEKIDDYVVADLKMGYTFNHLCFIDKLKLSLELTILFDHEYVSVINAMDDSRAGNTSYYVGAPFTAMMTASFAF
jgi:iron complex outermembrane receptor protein